MADIRINQLPLATGPTSPMQSDFVPIDGTNTRKATLLSLADVINPPASQAEAEAGTDAVKRMTALTTAQAIDARALTPEDVGTTPGTVAAGNDSRIVDAYAHVVSTVSVMAFIPLTEWASILNFTSTTDHYAYVQAAYDQAKIKAPNGVVVVEWPAGRINLSQAVKYTVPGTVGNDYLLNGIITRGKGPLSTKVFATTSNTEGLIHITTPFAKTKVTFEDISGISQLNSLVNSGQNNGTMFWVKSASSDPVNGYGGLNPDWTVSFKRVSVTGDDNDSGNAVLNYGVWQYGIRCDFQWLPSFEDVLVRCNSDASAQAFGYANNLISGIHLNYCYNPQFDRCNLLGYHLNGIFYGKPLTGSTFTRSEGGCAVNCEFGNARDGLVIDQAVNVELSIQPPNFRIIACDFNNKRFNISVRNWSQLYVDATTQIIQTQQYVATARDTGASTGNIAGIRLEDVCDVMIDGVILGGSQNGYFTNLANCAVGVLCLGRTANVTIRGQMNFNGVGVYANTIQSSNTFIPRRSITADIEVKGTQTTARTFQKVYDPNGVIMFEEREQSSTQDIRRLKSAISSSTFSPILKIRRERTDFATPAVNIPEGSMEFEALAKNGTSIVISYLRSVLIDNSVDLQPDAGLAIGVMKDGIETEYLYLDGNGDRIIARRLTRFDAPIIKPVYLKAQLVGNLAANFVGAGAEVHVSDDVGGYVPAFSDGTNWRRVTDRAIIS